LIETKFYSMEEYNQFLASQASWKSLYFNESWYCRKMWSAWD